MSSKIFLVYMEHIRRRYMVRSKKGPWSVETTYADDETHYYQRPKRRRRRNQQYMGHAWRLANAVNADKETYYMVKIA